MRRSVRSLGLLAALLPVLWTGAPAQAQTTAVKQTAECQGDWLPATPTSAEIMSGKLSLLGLPAVPVGKDVNWRMDPYRNRSWQMVFHSLRWMARLVADYETTGETAYLKRAIEIAKDWVADNPYGGRNTSKYAWDEHPIALRAPALVCLSRHHSASWLTKTLARHAKLLADPRNYEAGHNHGLDQDIGLLRIGCRYRNTSWQRLAVRRMVRSMKLDIDSQGALLGADRGRRGRRAGTPAPPPGLEGPGVPGRLRLRPHRVGRPGLRLLLDLVRPGRKFHGHDDHLSVTYYAQGRSILTEAGFHSYENSAYRKWTISPEAHNVPIVVGKRFRPKARTSLVGKSIRADRQSFTLTDKAYGVRRTRSVLVNHGDDLLAVLDTAGGDLRNLWHFDPGLKVASSSGGKVVVTDGDWRATLVQLAMPSCKPITGQRVVIGQSRPIQGWVSPSYLKKVPAPVVISPAARSLLTILVPGTGDPEVTCAKGKVTVQTPGGAVTLRVGSSGTLA
ncbi:heparinase II/III family protein [Thermobispora bispora]|uniref:Uncharacterized protein n=1 Tax=Thermobispora bispora (strain ATCC 19993 / DSM 43833 / CBS 139.67 / JCM 10125 / KCTC 9307 / NBRC 14880 / R51) TaxID=469371 RepID=D6Y691_THEBD|nr:heparinase II/III family protein [Thermobispora bispora]ADG89507.1 hypothetical protein Tbis_2808 [Thermobispora bispora DSM 43833]